jgi:hypothetical protein
LAPLVYAFVIIMARLNSDDWQDLFLVLNLVAIL